MSPKNILLKATPRETSRKKRVHSFLWPEADVVDDDKDDGSDANEDDNDEFVPQWFQQLAEFCEDSDNSDSVE